MMGFDVLTPGRTADDGQGAQRQGAATNQTVF
jgi:hypothetical protein